MASCTESAVDGIKRGTAGSLSLLRGFYRARFARDTQLVHFGRRTKLLYCIDHKGVQYVPFVQD